ncbi:MAG: D-alanyl-D-alanine carboxypeptidase family protein [Streptosporangiaceae bacterium]
MPRSRWIGPLASFRRAAIPAAVAVTAAAVIAPVSAAVPAQAAGQLAARTPGPIAARAAELANAATTRQLWGRRQYSPRPIASLTKVMTALVVVQSGDLGRRIRVTRADEAYLGCCIQGAGLKVGDVLTARALLNAMLLPSGADAARALAVSYGPGWPAFVRKMNATARRLRLVRTHFTNFDGVPSADVSTPRNLLLLGEAAMKQPAFRAVVAHRTYRIAAGRHRHAYYWQNTNLLLGRYPGVIGIKTGWTPAAGECLLFEAVRGKKTLIGVVLDSAPTKSGAVFTDAARMLNWGFRLHHGTASPRPPAGVPAE